MMELRFIGQPAAPGLARGRVHVLKGIPEIAPGSAAPAASAAVAGREPGRESGHESGHESVADPELDLGFEARELTAAIVAASAELRVIISRLEEDLGHNRDAVGILGFQLAFLQDGALAAAAREVIAAGLSASDAWAMTMARQIRGYELAEDEYFRARTSDLRDIRDRVFQCLHRGTSALTEWLPKIPQGALLVAADLPPSRFLAIDWSRAGGLVLLRGSPASHVAMLARTHGVPMVVGLDQAAPLVASWQGTDAILDANVGELIINPGVVSVATFSASRQREAVIDEAAEALRLKSVRTADGTPIRLYINIADLTELDDVDPGSCDGIGLARTEFLFLQRSGLPDEATQYLAYRRLVEWAAGRTVTIRTLDVGGDKPVAGLTLEGESNPFLGVRGLRLSFARPEVFAVQLRALARAAAHGEIRLMVPMVTLPQELSRVRELLEIEIAALAAAGTAVGRPIVGMMVEVPAAAITADQFDAGFFSIGSNDLAQYVSAVGRDVGALAHLASPTQPAMLRLIRSVVDAGNHLGIETSLCGDAASDPAEVEALLGAGLRTLSVAPLQLARVKLAVTRTRLAAVQP